MTSGLQPHREFENGTYTYTFSSRPRPIHAPYHLKYRELGMMQYEGQLVYGNIMYDRRIIRGNTYAQHIMPITSRPDPVEIQRQQEARKRATAKKLTKDQFHQKSPGILDERKHIDVQTDSYLEELSDHIEEISVVCQTDAFLDKPATPLFILAKSGKDVATQIEEGELFNFYTEVQPVLEVLIGKTMEQALLEVLEEEELAGLRAQQRAFLELHNAEQVEVQRLEEQERRHCDEKNRRIKQQRQVLQKEKEIVEKIAARRFSQNFLADLLPSVFTNLRDHGYFYNPVQRDVETGFLPWLITEVSKTLEMRSIAHTVLDMLIQDVISCRQEVYQDVNSK